MSTNSNTELIAKRISLFYYPQDSEVEIRAQKRNGKFYRTVVEQKTNVTFMTKRRWEIFKQQSDLVVSQTSDSTIVDFCNLQPREEMENGKYMIVPSETSSSLRGNHLHTTHTFACAYVRNGELFVDFYWFAVDVDDDKASDIFKVDFSKFVEC